LKIANLRFYSAGQDGGGAGTSQGDNGASQGDNREEKDTPQGGADNGGDVAQDAKERKLSEENAKRRIENQQLKEQLTELNEQIENLKSANMTDAEKLQKAQDKQQKQMAELERKAKEAERLLFSSRAVLTHKLPEVLSDLLRGETQDEVDEHAKLVSSALEKHYREKFRPQAPDTEGGDRHERNGGKMTVLDAQDSKEFAGKW
jgi:hypothetical protein